MIDRICILTCCIAAAFAAVSELGDRVISTPPSITVEPEQVKQYKLYESVKLSCHATGDPIPRYSWTKNNKDFQAGVNEGRISMQLNSGTLIITNAQIHDEAIYQCFAKNGFGTAVSGNVYLRRARLDPFPTVTAATYTPLVGSALTLPCIPPTSYPIPKVFWSITEPGRDHFTPLQYSARVNIDHEGNLRFANIEAGDNLNGGKYVCTVHNDFLRQFVQGADAIVTPTIDTARASSVTLMWSSPTRVIALRGERKAIKCIFAGYPTPEVKWESATLSNLPSGTRVDSYNQELVFDRMEFDHAGSYVCKGTNGNTANPSNKNFVIVVESKPYWTTQPQDVNAAEEEEAEFVCKADGDPKPRIDWFINGLPILNAPPNPRRHYDENDPGRIQFFDLEKEDAQVLQCNASNKYGWVFKNAYLNVLADPPAIIEAPPNPMKLAEGKDYVIKCTSFGAPKPIMSWTKETQEVTGGRFRTLPDGSLQVTRVQSTDAGRYVCKAINKFGEDTASTNVIVRKPTRISVGPSDMTVQRGREAKFTCTASTDPEETVRIIWKKDGQEIDYATTQRISVNNWDNSLLVSGTTALDTGEYTCFATNGLDNDEKTARLTVQAEPNPPTLVRTIECYSRTARIKWQPGPNNNAPILNFIIQFNTTYSPWQVANSNISSSTVETTVSLSPWANYTFRVLARNMIGESLPSERTDTSCRTDPDQPDKNPENVRTEDEGQNKLVIAWQAMQRLEQNGPGFHYVVNFRRADIPSQLNTTRIDSPQQWKLNFAGPTIPIYKPYRITIKAFNGQGGARVEPKEIIGFSGEDAPSQVVRNFRLDPTKPVKAKEAYFLWNPVAENATATNGFFMGYMIQFWKKGEEGNKRNVRIVLRDPKDEGKDYLTPALRKKRQAMVNGQVQGFVNRLPPYSDIMASVKVINKNYAGRPSNIISFRTLEGVPGPVGNLEIVEIGPNHVTLSWTKPIEPNGVIVGYDIDYQRMNGMTPETRQQRRPQINDPTVTQTKVWNLESDSKYSIFLIARTKNGRGEENFIEGNTDTAGAPGAPFMKIAGQAANAVNVTWTPNQDAGSKPASHFYVQYRKKDSTEWQRTPYESESRWSNVTGLDPGYTYQIRVVASNGPAHEAASATQEVTMGVADPEAVTNVAGAGWFIALMCIIAFLVLVLIIVCVVRQNRGDKYPVIEKEMLRGAPVDDNNFQEFTRPEDPYRKSQGSLDSDVKPGMESDTDSMAAYDDDPTKFNEDGSFIGQYGAKKPPPPEPDATSPSAMSTFV